MFYVLQTKWFSHFSLLPCNFFIKELFQIIFRIVSSSIFFFLFCIVSGLKFSLSRSKMFKRNEKEKNESEKTQLMISIIIIKKNESEKKRGLNKRILSGEKHMASNLS